MTNYQESYLGFSISINVTDVYQDGFRCRDLNINSPKGKLVMMMSSSKRFPAEAGVKAFGLDWAKAWIDKHNGQ